VTLLALLLSYDMFYTFEHSVYVGLVHTSFHEYWSTWQQVM